MKMSRDIGVYAKTGAYQLRAENEEQRLSQIRDSKRASARSSQVNTFSHNPNPAIIASRRFLNQITLAALSEWVG